MASTTPRLPALLGSASDEIDFTVSELMSEAAGAHSPFGDTEFPMPIEKLRYIHPTAAERPNLADGQ